MFRASGTSPLEGKNNQYWKKMWKGISFSTCMYYLHILIACRKWKEKRIRLWIAFFIFIFSEASHYLSTMPVSKVFARQIFDSRGNPTVEVDVQTEKGKWIISYSFGPLCHRLCIFRNTFLENRKILSIINTMYCIQNVTPISAWLFYFDFNCLNSK